jgi:putative transposase
MKTFEFRLYPNRKQCRQLDSVLAESRIIYNEMLAHTKQVYQETGKCAFKYSLTKVFAGRGKGNVPASTVQMLADRLDKALKRFIRRKESDQTVGFPRFKTPNRWHSIQLRQHAIDFDVDGRFLRTPALTGGRIKIKRHRPIVGTPQTCHLVKRADGHWYALIVCEMPEPAPPTEPPASDERPAIGIDVGLKSFLTDSDGNTVANPRHYRTSQAKLRRKQRRLSARKKGSKRRRKMARSVAQTHLKIERQRRDFHFKTARHYADAYRLIVVEDLNVRGLARTRLAKSILDAGWSAFLTILTDKAASAGGQVIRMNPRFTTQTCSNCGELVPKSLSVRTHICPACGYVADRDQNAAINILRAGAPPSGTVADRLPDEPRSPIL